MRSWPLTGRAAELAAAREALTLPGRCRGVAIIGPAGVGKTRLARECAALLEADGHRPRWFQATAASQALPLGVFAGVLPQDRVDLLRVCVDAAAVLTKDDPACLVVDDAHQLDTLSAALLLHLATNASVRLVLTIRAGEPVPDAVAALTKEQLVERIDLSPLTEPEAVELLRAALGAPVDEASAQALAALSQGNTLYLREVVLGELRASRLVLTDSRWVWAGGFRASAALAALVDATALAVPPAVRDVLDLIAVAGDLDLDVVVACVDRSAVEEAQRAGLVELQESGAGWRVQAFHPLYAEVRRARVGSIAARRWRALVADALQADGSEHVLQHATLMLDSDRAAGAETYAVAAEQAIRLFDYGLGERLAQAAVDAGGGFDAGMLLAFAQGWSNHRDQASATCVRMVEESTTDVEVLRATIASAGHSFFMCAEPNVGVEALEAGRLRIDDPALAGLLNALESFFAACLAQPDEAVRLARPLLDLPGLAPQLQVCALFGLVAGLGLSGRIEEAVPAAERSWSIGSGAFDATHLRLGLVYLHVCGLVASGLVRQAIDVAGRRDHEIVAGRQASAMAGGFCGAALLASGDVPAATRRLERCCDEISGDTSGWRYHAAVLCARAYALAGRSRRAVDACAIAETLVHPGHLWFEPERLLTKAWVCASEGSVSEATAHCRRAARWSAAHGQLVHEVLALQTAAQLGDPGGAARLSALSGHVDGPRAAAAATHAAALAAGDGDRLVAAAEAYLALGDRVAAADAYAQAASRFAADGRSGSRSRAVNLAAALHEECGARTPELRACLNPLPLAAREREVATMAAHGLSNRAISTRLHLSVRTVEGHLYRAYHRLGVSSRRAAAEALRAGED